MGFVYLLVFIVWRYNLVFKRKFNKIRIKKYINFTMTPSLIFFVGMSSSKKTTLKGPLGKRNEVITIENAQNTQPAPPHAPTRHYRRLNCASELFSATIPGLGVGSRTKKQWRWQFDVVTPRKVTAPCGESRDLVFTGLLRDARELVYCCHPNLLPPPTRAQHWV